MDTDRFSNGLHLGYSLLGISSGLLLHYLVGGNPGCIYRKSYDILRMQLDIHLAPNVNYKLMTLRRL